MLNLFLYIFIYMLRPYFEFPFFNFRIERISLWRTISWNKCTIFKTGVMEFERVHLFVVVVVFVCTTAHDRVATVRQPSFSHLRNNQPSCTAKIVRQLTSYDRSRFRRGFSVPDFANNFPEFYPISLLYFPILCKLDNLTFVKSQLSEITTFTCL